LGGSRIIALIRDAKPHHFGSGNLHAICVASPDFTSPMVKSIRDPANPGDFPAIRKQQGSGDKDSRP
jgi:hypothetical protein